MATGQPTQLQITGLRQFYSAPYLLDFSFAIRDQSNNAVVLNPSQFNVVCKENGQAISSSESGYRLLSGDNKQLKGFLVLDYTRSMIDPAINGDSDGDYIADSVEAMETGAKSIIGAMHADVQLGLFEFHRADTLNPPARIASLTVDKTYLTNQIDRIYTNVMWTSGSSRCWDALYLALDEFPTNNPYDGQRFVVFLSDGKDESSTRSPNDVVSLAQTKGVHIYCIGYGIELAPSSLQNITMQTGGQYYPAGSAAEMAQRFNQIVSDLAGQYVLRWATLKRGNNSFVPSFELTFSGVKVTTTAGSYDPFFFEGDEMDGHLYFESSLSQNKVATLVLGAAYMPRGVTRIRLNFATAFPFTVERIAYEEGGVCPINWSFTMNQSAGVGYFEFSSPAPANPFSALPFAILGKLVKFQIHGVTNLTDCFYDLGVDNSFYQQPGGSSFVLDNAAEVSIPCTTLPHGTPFSWLNQYGFTNGLVFGEISDPDGDGSPTWIEYLAGTNPTNKQSCFQMQNVVSESGGWQITFDTESNRIYRVDYSEALSTWQLLQSGIVGNGKARTVIDMSNRPQSFYKVTITALTNPPPGMAWIPSGSFTMGDTTGDSYLYGGYELPTHAVHVSGFYMDKYEVTKALWDEVKSWAQKHGYTFDYVGLGKATNHPVHTLTGMMR